MLHVFTTQKCRFECELRNRRQRRAIWALSIALVFVLMIYAAQVCETVKSDRKICELQEQCDEFRNSIGIANYELGVMEEERWGR